MNDLEMEQEIDLRDLFYRICRHWRSILAGAVIAAVLAGGYTLVRGLISLMDDEKQAEAQQKYNIALNDYEATGERLKRNIANLQDKLSNQQEYNEKSLLMKIDPMNKWVGSFVMYVDSQYKIDPALTYQNIDLTGRLTIAYGGYLTGGELYNEILSETGIADDVRFLTEILKSEVDTSSASIKVSFIGTSSEEVQGMLDLIKRKLYGKYEEVETAIGEHSLEILTESCYSTIDLTLDEQQKTNLLAVSQISNSMGEVNTELTEWSTQPPPKVEYGLAYIVKQAIKFVIIGGVAGAALVILFYCARYVLGGRMWTGRDWNRMGMTIVAGIPRPTKGSYRRLDRWIDKVIGGVQREQDITRGCRIAAGSMENLLREKSLPGTAVISELPGEQAAEVSERIAANMNGYGLVFVGSILTDPEAAKKINEYSDVVLLEENGASVQNDVRKELTLLHAWGKQLLGVIVLE